MLAFSWITGPYHDSPPAHVEVSASSDALLGAKAPEFPVIGRLDAVSDFVEYYNYP